MVLANSSPEIAIVIVNWERPDDTIECLNSIYATGCQDIDILLVDNGSTDGSTEKIKLIFPELNIFRLPKNLGFANGYNEGIRLALETGAKNIFLLNNDTIVERDAVAVFKSSQWDVTTPKILYFHKPDLIWSAGCYWRTFPPSVIMRGYNQKDGPKYSKPGPLDYATSCALWIKRPVLEIVGGFDQNYSSYMEDYDFSYRIRAAGFSIGYMPEARIFHKVSQSLGADSAQRWRLQGRNTVLFYRKDGRFPDGYLFAFLAWFTIRELLKGNAAILPSFWEGVKEGLGNIRQNA
jgi:GT2 family glycosyltransferase